MSKTHSNNRKNNIEEVSRQKRYRVPYIDLHAAFLSQRAEMLHTLEDICSSGRFILRDEVEKFESKIARFLGVKYAIGVGSGTDALVLALKALGVESGDEVITVAHTFVATIAAIIHSGATPVLVDICAEGYTMDTDALTKAITPRTKAIIPVHLNGRSCDMDRIRALAADRGIAIIEDAAQALGTRYKGKMAGALGDAGCFSFHPMKTLSCFGDGGLVATDSETVADSIRLYRNHGQRTKSCIALYGHNSRLDNLQAGVLLTKLNIFSKMLEKKRAIAARYHQALVDAPDVRLPFPPESELYWDAYSSYVIRAMKRDDLQQYLLSVGIETFAHWHPPLHKQPALGLSGINLPVTEEISNEVLSLPIYPEMSDEQIEFVISSIRNFYEGK
ncbi:MAG: DegT/DnrJ/EryC1/StrS family aminotransferase [Nitrospirae bacterium]|nr:DegT/DnrJ/EryC1/StrS family aminotransferase [Nitrospirota bacterium]